jgi:Carboxypeptidase regulatory-like domain
MGGNVFKINFGALVLIQLLCLQIELPAQSQAKEAKPGASAVSGRVTYKGEPVSGAIVSLRPEQMTGPPDPNSILRARTDRSGKYRINGVAAGRYNITATAPGFGLFNDLPHQVLKINEGENVENLDFELKRGGAITGRVTDSNNSPLVGVKVGLMRSSEGGRAAPLAIFDSRMGSTDDRGSYRFYGLPEGRYLVNVGVSPALGSPLIMRGPSNSYLPRTFHPNVTEESKAKVIEVSEGSEITDVDIVVAEARKTYNIYGRVVSAESGEPVAGVELSCGYLSENLPGVRGVTSWGPPGQRSDAKGEFRLQGLLPGKLMLYANLGLGSEVYSEVEALEISESDIREVEIKVRQGNSISGVIVIEGTSDPALLSKVSELELLSSVMTKELGPPTLSRTQANADGGFRIKGLRPGKVRISMGQRSTSRRFSVLRIERDGVAMSEYDLIEIGQGENISGLRVVVGYAGSAIQGEVKIVGGTLPANQSLYVNARRLGDPRSIPALAETDARRRFVFENLLPGEYELTISPIHGPQVVTPFSTAIPRVRQRVVVGSDSRPTVLLEINLNRSEGNR